MKNTTIRIDRNTREVIPIIKSNKTREFWEESLKDEEDIDLVYKNSIGEFSDSLENISVILKKLDLWRIEQDKKINDLDLKISKTFRTEESFKFSENLEKKIHNLVN